jgi:chemotaxis signal transduction protein
MTSTFARSEAPDEPSHHSSETIVLAICRLGDRLFALPTAAVRQILRMPELTPLPATIHDVAGLISIHGVVWPVVDPRPRLALATPEVDPGQRLILLSALTRYALWVDEVERIESVSSAHLRHLSGDAQHAATPDIAHISGVILPILSVSAFDPGEMFEPERSATP